MKDIQIKASKLDIEYDGLKRNGRRSLLEADLAAAHLWNIYKNRLFREKKIRDFKGYCDSIGLSRRTAYNMLQKADIYAKVVFGDMDDKSEYYLTENHVKDCHFAKDQIKEYAVTDIPLLLPAGPQFGDDNLDLEIIEHDDSDLTDINLIQSQYESTNVSKALTTKRRPAKKNLTEIQTETIAEAVGNLERAAHLLLSAWNSLDGTPSAHPLRKPAAYYINLCIDYITKTPRNPKKIKHPLPFINFDQALSMISNDELDEEQRPDVYHAYSGEIR